MDVCQGYKMINAYLYSVKQEDQISEELNKIGRVVLFITGDESATFKVDKIKHGNIEIWIQYPHRKHSQYNKLALGVPQHLSKIYQSIKISRMMYLFQGR
jgi:hypothetical protein